MTKLNKHVSDVLNGQELDFTRDFYIGMTDSYQDLVFNVIIKDAQQVADTLGITEELNKLGEAGCNGLLVDLVTESLDESGIDTFIQGLE